MSLTLLIGDTSVAIVRWFLDSNGLVIFACGPLIETSSKEFQATGYDVVRVHFEQYRSVRLPRNKFVAVFPSGQAKKFMKRRQAVQIDIDAQEQYLLTPLRIEKYSLGDLKRVSPAAVRTIPGNSPPEVFWKAFSATLADAPRDL